MKFKRERNTRSYQMCTPGELALDCRFCSARVGEECRNAEGETRRAHQRRREDARRLEEFAARVNASV